jgi:catechol 2,3-dioxygenase-like lactoylglutathione lyase family enzyme
MTSSMRIHHVNLMVDDLAAADAFYGDVLGLDRASTPDLGFPAQFYALDGGQQLHVNELDDTRPERAHFCLRVDDFDGVFARAREHDVIDVGTWGKVRRLPGGVMQLFVRDPAGNLIELSCEPDVHVDPGIFELDFVESDAQFFRRPD